MAVEEVGDDSDLHELLPGVPKDAEGRAVGLAAPWHTSGFVLQDPCAAQPASTSTSLWLNSLGRRRLGFAATASASIVTR